jgi:hypothetical protein
MVVVFSLVIGPSVPSPATVVSSAIVGRCSDVGLSGSVLVGNCNAAVCFDPSL